MSVVRLMVVGKLDRGRDDLRPRAGSASPRSRLCLSVVRRTALAVGYLLGREEQHGCRD